MKRKDFIEIMDATIETCEKYEGGGYTCIKLAEKVAWKKKERQGFHDSYPLVKSYSAVFGFDEETAYCKLGMNRMLNHGEVRVLKNTRLACLELYKEMMLSTKFYQDIEL